MAHASSNLVLQKGKQLAKWPKVKCRLIIPDTDENLGRAVVDTAPTSDEDTAELNKQIPRKQRKTKKADGDIDISEIPPSETPLEFPIEELQPSRSSDDMMDLDDEYFWTQFCSGRSNHEAHQFPGLHYVNQGIVLCDNQVEKGKMISIDGTYCQYSYPVGTRNFD